MTTADNQHQNEVLDTLEEIREASLGTQSILHDETNAGSDLHKSDLNKVVTETEAKMLRERSIERANRERQKGQKDLARREEGIASLITVVTINARAIASAFQRRFYKIENGIYVVSSRGEFAIGAVPAKKLIDTIVKKIEAMEKKYAETLTLYTTTITEHKSQSPGFLEPEYTRPSAEVEVQLRTKLSVRVVNMFKTQDQIIAALQTLYWNNIVEEDVIEKQEAQLKRDTRILATFLTRALDGMYNKVAPMVITPAETAGITDTAAVPSNNDMIEAAA